MMAPPEIQLALHRGTVDLLQGVLMTNEGERVRLTPVEVALLATLHSHRPHAVSEEVLLKEAWGYRTTRSRTVVVTIQRLRKKLELDPRQPKSLVTVRGEGYRLRLADQPTPIPQSAREPKATLLGRQTELDEAAAALREPRALVTLVGPGGVGKTTLARLLSQAYRKPRWIDLVGVHTPAQLVRQATGTLQVPEPIADPSREIPAAMARCDLVVLDNAEELAEDALDHLVEWRRAARVPFLVTSQRPLRIKGERRVMVGELEEADARTLIASTREQAGLEPLSDEALDTAIRDLGGLPLALVIGAPVLDFVDAGQTETLLQLEADEVDRHHSSLAAAFQRTVQGLEPGEMKILQACAVFQSPPRVEHVAAVAQAPLPQTLKGLTVLRDRGLVRSVQGRSATLPLIRSWVTQGSVDFEHNRAAHARWVLDLPPSIAVQREHRAELLAALAWADGEDRLELLDRHVRLLQAVGPMAELAPDVARALQTLDPRWSVQGRILLIATRPEDPASALTARDLVAQIPEDQPHWKARGFAALAMAELERREGAAARDAALEGLEWAASVGSLAIRTDVLYRLGVVLARLAHPKGTVALSTAQTESARDLPQRSLECAIALARWVGSSESHARGLEDHLRRVERIVGRVTWHASAGQLGLVWLELGARDRGRDWVRRALAFLDDERPALARDLRVRAALRQLDDPDWAAPMVADLAASDLVRLVHATIGDGDPTHIRNRTLRLVAEAWRARQPLPPMKAMPQLHRALQGPWDRAIR